MEYTKGAQNLFNAIISLRKVFRIENVLKNLSFNELRVLGIIACKEKESKEKELIQVKDLSEYMRISRPALNTVLNRLEDNDLIERVRSNANRKAVFIALKDQARIKYKEEFDPIINLMNSLVEKLGDNDTFELVRLINKLEEIVSKEVKDA